MIEIDREIEREKWLYIRNKNRVVYLIKSNLRKRCSKGVW